MRRRTVSRSDPRDFSTYLRLSAVWQISRYRSWVYLSQVSSTYLRAQSIQQISRLGRNRGLLRVVRHSKFCHSHSCLSNFSEFFRERGSSAGIFLQEWENIPKLHRKQIIRNRYLQYFSESHPIKPLASPTFLFLHTRRRNCYLS